MLQNNTHSLTFESSVFQVLRNMHMAHAHTMEFRLNNDLTSISFHHCPLCAQCKTARVVPLHTHTHTHTHTRTHTHTPRERERWRDTERERGREGKREGGKEAWRWEEWRKEGREEGREHVSLCVHTCTHLYLRDADGLRTQVGARSSDSACETMLSKFATTSDANGIAESKSIYWYFV